jgi:pseudo-rSAM protein
MLLNSIDKSYIIIENKYLFDKISRLKNHYGCDYFVYIEEKYYNKLIRIFEEIENKNIGFIANKNKIHSPLALPPLMSIDNVNINEHFHLINTNSINSDELKSKNSIIGNNLINLIKEITIQVNGVEIADSKTHLAYLQYNFPITNKVGEINFYELESFLDIAQSSQIRVNFIIAKVDSKIVYEINKIINLHRNHFIFYIYSTAVNIKLLLDINIDYHNFFAWIVDNEAIDYVNGVNYAHLITSSHSLSMIESIITEDIYPLYTGNNLSFCSELLEYDINDCPELNINENILFSNKYINRNLFGELVIDFNGNVYSDISKNKISNINIENIKEAIFNELSIYKNWNVTREKMQPCNNCIFNILCPAISKFELCTFKYNFCINNQ